MGMTGIQTFDQTRLQKELIYDSRDELNSYLQTDSLKLPAQYRLAFREFGLSIGLYSVENIKK